MFKLRFIVQHAFNINFNILILMPIYFQPTGRQVKERVLMQFGMASYKVESYIFTTGIRQCEVNTLTSIL